MPMHQAEQDACWPRQATLGSGTLPVVMEKKSLLLTPLICTLDTTPAEIPDMNCLGTLRCLAFTICLAFTVCLLSTDTCLLANQASQHPPALPGISDAALATLPMDTSPTSEPMPLGVALSIAGMAGIVIFSYRRRYREYIQRRDAARAR